MLSFQKLAVYQRALQCLVVALEVIARLPKGHAELAAQLSKTSPRKMPAVVPELDYPQHDDVLRVDRVGYVSHRRRRCYLSSALAHQTVGIREELDGRWLVSFVNVKTGSVHVDAVRSGQRLRFASPSPSPSASTVRGHGRQLDS